MSRALGRRTLLCWLGGAAAWLPAARILGQPSDRGIGGTGFAPGGDRSGDDRGIGGTGVIGTIRKFGSIYVNDLRIAYDPDVAVRIDGQAARAADLRLGQVVRVAALGADGRFSTRTIDVTSEVVGPVQRVAGRSLTVLGQRVDAGKLKTAMPKVGDVVAVSGLRRNDGTIVASLIERRPGAPSRVAGPVDVAADGSPAIGGLSLAGLPPELIDRRALVEGRLEGGRFVVENSTAESALLGGVRALSVESYVERRGDDVALGSGYAVGGGATLAFPAGLSLPAIVTATLGGDGRLVIDSVATGGRTYGTPSVGGGGGAGNGDRGGSAGGGTHSMDFGRPGGGGSQGGGLQGGGLPGGGPPGGGGGGGGGGGPGGGPSGFGGGGIGGGPPGGGGGGGMGGGGMGDGGMGGGGMGGGGHR